MQLKSCILIGFQSHSVTTPVPPSVHITYRQYPQLPSHHPSLSICLVFILFSFFFFLVYVQVYQCGSLRTQRNFWVGLGSLGQKSRKGPRRKSPFLTPAVYKIESKKAHAQLIQQSIQAHSWSTSASPLLILLLVLWLFVIVFILESLFGAMYWTQGLTRAQCVL